LNGGKALGSNVKYAKFYLIVDPAANPEIHVPTALAKFIAALRKTMQTGKQGEAAFKPSAEGTFFNAYSSIADSFKNIEEAINQSGANGDRVATA